MSLIDHIYRLLSDDPVRSGSLEQFFVNIDDVEMGTFI